MYAWVASPPSPLVPATPGPATVVMVPAPRAGAATPSASVSAAAEAVRARWRIGVLSEPEAAPMSSLERAADLAQTRGSTSRPRRRGAGVLSAAAREVVARRSRACEDR